MQGHSSSAQAARRVFMFMAAPLCEVRADGRMNFLTSGLLCTGSSPLPTPADSASPCPCYERARSEVAVPIIRSLFGCCSLHFVSVCQRSAQDNISKNALDPNKLAGKQANKIMENPCQSCRYRIALFGFTTPARLLREKDFPCEVSAQTGYSEGGIRLSTLHPVMKKSTNNERV